jgi:hypothetical protein
VNFTAGLPAVRTSPDHGLAYDLAGTGRADVTSFVRALYAAIDITRHRRESIAIEEGSMWKSPPEIPGKKERKGRGRPTPPPPKARPQVEKKPAPVPDKSEEE